MIHTPAVSRHIRFIAAFVGAVGAFGLAGCASTATPTDTEPTTAPETEATTAAPDAGTDAGTETSTYVNGSYTASGSYATPESVETIVVTITLQDDVVTDVEITGDPQKSESEEYQGRFIGGIDDVVIGQDIDSLSVSRVAGSSLTSGGFNQAIETIKAEAAA